MSDTFEKKTERVEVRVSHTKKQAFSDACDEQGDTPSHAIRRFINSYIRRSDADAINAGFRAFLRMPKQYWKPISVSVVGLLLIAFITSKMLHKPTPIDGPIVSASNGPFPPINYTLFSAYDKNANGVLDLGEITNNDEHLHRVLNLDGKAGISPAEFYEEGHMQWTYMKGKSLETHIDGDLPTAAYTPIGKAHLVTFNLTDLSNPIITVETPEALSETTVTLINKNTPLHFKETTTTTKKYKPVNRVIGWSHGQTTPTLTFTDHDYRVRYGIN